VIKIRINGTTKQISPNISITDLLNELALPKEGIAVAVNGEVIPRDQHGLTLINEEDQIEVIRAVAGG
tara:strand:+ start:114242 stop:114445 length:204 start_codon:yes stop_codon:yes gene_type:complete